MSDLINKIRAAQVHAGEQAVIKSLHDRGICGGCEFCKQPPDPYKALEIAREALDKIYRHKANEHPTYRIAFDALRQIDEVMK